MTSRALFFKLMREDFKKKIWIIIVGLLVSVFIGPIRILMRIENMMLTNAAINKKMITDSLYYELQPYKFGNSVLPAIIALLLAIVGFAYLFNKKKVDMYHSLPIKRERLFAIIYLNGIISYLIISVTTVLLTMIEIMSKGFLTADNLSMMWMVFLGSLVYFLFFYHVAIMAVMLTGNLLVGVIGAGVLFFYGWFMQDLLENYFGQCFVSYYQFNIEFVQYIPFISPVSSVAKWISLYDDMQTVNGGKIALCLAIAFVQALIALAVAFILYKKRNSEAAGKAISFKPAQLIIKICLMIMFSLMGGIYCSLFARNGYNSLFWYWFGFIVVAVFAHCLIEIIYHIDFRACFRNKLQSLIIIGVAALIGSCFQYDWLGYDSYLPDQNQIDHCAIVFHNINSEMSSYEFMEREEGNTILAFSNKDQYFFDNMKISNPEQVLELARQGILNERDPHTYTIQRMNQESVISYSIKYHLTNGRDVYRTYTADVNSIQNALSEIYQSKEYKDAEIFLTNIFEKDLCDKVIGYNAWDEKIFTLTGEQTKEFLKIYLEERYQLSIHDMQTQMPVIQVTPQIQGSSYVNIDGYYIYPSFVKSLQKLEEYGISISDYETELDPEKILSIEVNDYGFFSSDKEDYTANHIVYKSSNGKEDQEKIKELSEALVLAKFAWANNTLYRVTDGIECSIVYQNEAGVSKESSANIKSGQIPKFLQEDVESEGN